MAIPSAMKIKAIESITLENRIVPLVYFVSGMWCGTCAKAVQAKVSVLPGVGNAELNFLTKLLILTPSPTANVIRLGERICQTVAALGYTAHIQTGNWTSRYSTTLTNDREHAFSDVRFFLTLFFAMWTSMFALARYSGGFSGSPQEAFFLATLTALTGAPAVILGISPYATAAWRALKSGSLSIDLIITSGAVSALVLSAVSLSLGKPEVYLDSAAMIVALLQITKWFEAYLAKALSLRLMFQMPCSDANVEVLRKAGWANANAAQVSVGDHVRYRAGQILSLDGILVSDKMQATEELLSGETFLQSYESGAELRSGMCLFTDAEVQVTAAVGERLIDRWTKSALTSLNSKASAGGWYQLVEKNLVAVSLLGSVGLGLLAIFTGKSHSKALESFFIGVLLFCPCLFVSILPMAQAIALIALRRLGFLLRAPSALDRLASVQNFAFDKTGTLLLYQTEWECLETGTSKILEPLLAAAKACSSHPILQGLRVPTDLGARLGGWEAEPIIGEGLRMRNIAAENDLMLGRARWLAAEGIPLPAGVSLESDTLVAFNRRVVGRLLPAAAHTERAQNGIAALMQQFPSAKFLVVTGDSNPREQNEVAQVFSSRIEYHGGLSPEQKADIVRKLDNCFYIGDGLNDTAALNVATVSARVGRGSRDMSEVDLLVLGHGLDKLASVISYAKLFQSVVRQTILISFVYNIAALYFAVRGYFSPMTAALAMLSSFVLMVLSILRLSSCSQKESQCG